MSLTYYDSNLTNRQIDAALHAVYGLIVPANDGKIVFVENGKLVAEDVTGYVANLEELTVTANGEFRPPSGVDGFSAVHVNVQGTGGEPVLQDITITENGTYIPPAGVDGYNLIAVSVFARSPRCDQIVNFDWATEQRYMAWMDGTPEPRPEPVPPSPLPGPSVSFSSGTDEEIAAAIDAAHAGTIDLRNGENAWDIGDTRTVHLYAWDGGKDRFLNPVSHPAQDLTIAISSFAKYMDCGNVLQFDFTQYPDGLVIMDPSNMNVGGYGATEMYTTTLPAMVQALPQWLQDRLISFPVRASAGNDSSTIVTVTGNKLALRSEVEIFGRVIYSKPGEGVQVEYYRTAANRVKTRASTGNVGHWWERSPTHVFEGQNGAFGMVLSNGEPLQYTARSDIGVAPFGCL